MSVVILEVTHSRDIRTAGGLTASRRFFGYDDADTNPLIEDIIEGDGMPSPGDPHPDTPNLVANNYTMSPSRERSGSWEVTWNYLPSDIPIPTGPGDPLPTEEPIEFTDIDVSLSLTVVDAWRSGPDIEVATGSNDIGGTEIHSQGYPVSVALSTVNINVGVEVTASTLYTVALLNSVGKRNSNTFFGLPAGSVLYKGSSIVRREWNIWDVTYEFAYDPWLHKRQVPARDVDGNPAVVLTDSPTLPVYWRQPFPDLTTFNWVE